MLTDFITECVEPRGSRSLQGSQGHTECPLGTWKLKGVSSISAEAPPSWIQVTWRRSAFLTASDPCTLGGQGRTEFFQRIRPSIYTARSGVLTVENTLAISSWRFINIVWWGKGKTTCLFWVWSCVTLTSQHVRHMHPKCAQQDAFSTEHWIKNKLLMETRRNESESESKRNTNTVSSWVHIPGFFQKITAA